MDKVTEFLGLENYERIVRILTIILISATVVWILFPLYWSLSSALKTRPALFSTPPPVFVFRPTLANFQELLTRTAFITYFKNSAIITTGTTVITTTLSTIAGYGLTRAGFRGKRNLARSVLFAYMFPPIMLGIPLYRIFFELDLLNSYPALILGHTAILLPFGIWLMWQYFQTVPIAYEESAWINGASKFTSFKDVALPMARPGIVAISIFTFAISWNEFTLSVIIMTEKNMFPLSVGILSFIEQTTIHWGLINSAVFLVMLPSIILVVFLQRYILLGFGRTF